MPLTEYPAGRSFPGVMSRTADESAPAWSAPLVARKAHAELDGRMSGDPITDPSGS
jgi:hypothetical protein